MDIEIKSNIVSEQDAVEILTQMKIDYDKQGARFFRNNLALLAF